MDTTGQERRKHPRIPMTARATLAGSSERDYLFTRDLSLGGAGLLSDKQIPIGTIINLEFSVADVPRLIKVKAKVVRHFDLPEKGFGVLFTAFKPHSRRRLEKALNKMVIT